jgi:glycosyltransferase involved in cell wall biosynthesis
MKILYHHRIRSKDGQYVHLEEMIKALQQLGHEIILAAPAAVTREKFGGESRALELLKRKLPNVLYELMEFSYTLLDYNRIFLAIKRSKPDIIYERYSLFLPSGILAKRHFGLPLILEVNAPLYEERKRYGGLALNGLARWSEKFVWTGADRVLSVTKVLANSIHDMGVPGKKITVIHNGVDLNKFRTVISKNEAKRKLKLDSKLVLGFVGFLREWHGLKEVVDIIKSNEDLPLHFLVVGDGPDRSRLEVRAKQLGIIDRLTITGVVSRERIVNYIMAFDIALQANVVAYASPLKLFEYMALQRAIVAPDKDNIREILTHTKDAMLFDSSSPKSLGRAIAQVAKDQHLRDKLGRAAKQKIIDRGFTWQRNAERVSQIASELVKNK